MHATLHLLARSKFPALKRRVLEPLQLNLGYRCNLTILEEPGFEDLADFLAAHRVEAVASMPCDLEENVDKQRGKGTFNASIKGLAALTLKDPSYGLGAAQRSAR